MPLSVNSLWTGSLFGKQIPWIVIYPKQGPLLMKQIPYNILTRCPEPSSPVSRQNFIRQTSFPAPRAPNRISRSHTLIFMRCPRAIRDRAASFRVGGLKKNAWRKIFLWGRWHACGFLFNFSKVTENANNDKTIDFFSSSSVMLLSGLKIHHH